LLQYLDLTWPALASIGSLLLVDENKLSSKQAIGVLCIFFAFLAQTYWEITQRSQGLDYWVLTGLVTALVVGVLLKPVVSKKKQIALPPFKSTDSDDQEETSDETAPDSERQRQYESILLDQRRFTVQAVLDQSNSFDKWILTLAAGTFGLSLAFINQIAPEPKGGTEGFLVTGWILFAVSIALTILSLLLSQKACRNQVEHIDNILLSAGEKPIRNSFGNWTTLFNIASGTAFLTGMVFLIVFATSNL
jgi:hypothetical protein